MEKKNWFLETSLHISNLLVAQQQPNTPMAFTTFLALFTSPGQSGLGLCLSNIHLELTPLRCRRGIGTWTSNGKQSMNDKEGT